MASSPHNSLTLSYNHAKSPSHWWASGTGKTAVVCLYFLFWMLVLLWSSLKWQSLLFSDLVCSWTSSTEKKSEKSIMVSSGRYKIYSPKDQTSNKSNIRQTWDNKNKQKDKREPSKATLISRHPEKSREKCIQVWNQRCSFETISTLISSLSFSPPSLPPLCSQSWGQLDPWPVTPLVVHCDLS